MVAKRSLTPGTHVTVDYTLWSLARRESHQQADWIMKLRNASRVAPPPGSVRHTFLTRVDVCAPRGLCRLSLIHI